ncbi:GNAT family N-acetyltransferase [Oscillospiraceae bacterium 38-13]
MTDFRKAGPGDRDAILHLVNRVFSGEQGIPKELHPVPEHMHPQWWCALREGQIVGTAALFVEDEVWHMGRIAVAPELRRQGIAAGLLEFALRDTFSQNVPRVFLEAQDTTIHIMRKFGARTLGEPQLFYGSAVTLVVLEQEDFFRSTGEACGTGRRNPSETCHKDAGTH